MSRDTATRFLGEQLGKTTGSLLALPARMRRLVSFERWASVLLTAMGLASLAACGSASSAASSDAGIRTGGSGGVAGTGGSGGVAGTGGGGGVPGTGSSGGVPGTGGTAGVGTSGNPCVDFEPPAAQVKSECPPQGVPAGGAIVDGDYTLVRRYAWDSACGGFRVRESLRVEGGTFALSTASDQVGSGPYVSGTRTRVLTAQATGDGILMLTSQCDVTTAIRDMTSDDVPQGVAEGLYAFSTRPDEIDFFSPGVTPTEPKQLVSTYRLTSAMP